MTSSARRVTTNVSRSSLVTRASSRSTTVPEPSIPSSTVASQNSSMTSSLPVATSTTATTIVSPSVSSTHPTSDKRHTITSNDLRHGFYVEGGKFRKLDSTPGRYYTKREALHSSVYRQHNTFIVPDSVAAPSSVEHHRHSGSRTKHVTAATPAISNPSTVSESPMIPLSGSAAATVKTPASVLVSEPPSSTIPSSVVETDSLVITMNPSIPTEVDSEVDDDDRADGPSTTSTIESAPSSKTIAPSVVSPPVDPFVSIEIKWEVVWRATNGTLQLRRSPTDTRSPSLISKAVIDNFTATRLMVLDRFMTMHWSLTLNVGFDLIARLPTDGPRISGSASSAPTEMVLVSVAHPYTDTTDPDLEYFGAEIQIPGLPAHTTIELRPHDASIPMDGIISITVPREATQRIWQLYQWSVAASTTSAASTARSATTATATTATIAATSVIGIDVKEPERKTKTVQPNSKPESNRVPTAIGPSHADVKHIPRTREPSAATNSTPPVTDQKYPIVTSSRHAMATVTSGSAPVSVRRMPRPVSTIPTPVGPSASTQQQRF